jgi:hypothetical protein
MQIAIECSVIDQAVTQPHAALAEAAALLDIANSLLIRSPRRRGRANAAGHLKAERFSGLIADL